MFSLMNDEGMKLHRNREPRLSSGQAQDKVCFEISQLEFDHRFNKLLPCSDVKPLQIRYCV